jgi:O-antigen ligase
MFIASFRASISISTVILLISSLSQKDIVAQLKRTFSSIYWWCFTGMAFVYILWDPIFIGTDEKYWPLLQVKAVFLFWPLIFHLHPPVRSKAQLFCYYFFMGAISLTALGSTIYYLSHFDEVQLLIKQSKSVPVVINHVRYSLMVVFGVFLGIILRKKKLFIWNEKVEKAILIGQIIFLIIFIHIMSVRSGLAAFYIVAGIYILQQLFISKQYKRGIAILAFLLLGPVMAYTVLPSFRTKVANTLEDLDQTGQVERANNYSLVGRLYSYKVGFSNFKDSPLVGVGPAGIKKKTDQKYGALYPVITKRIMPHNQFIHWLSSLGIIGLILMSVLFFTPLFMERNSVKRPVLFIQYTIVTISFLVEGTLETQYGVSYTLLFILLPLHFTGLSGTIKHEHS